MRKKNDIGQADCCFLSIYIQHPALKTAYYPVFLNTDITIIQGDQLFRKRITASRKHSNRSVINGLLTRGPGYKANKKDIAEMASSNAGNLYGLFRERRGMINRRGEFIEASR